MKKIIDKYAAKLLQQGLAEEKDITFIGLDADIVSNKPSADISPELMKVFGLMNINTVLCARPAEPYRSIIRHLTARYRDCIVPTDCETRTFFHDIPVIPALTSGSIATALSQRKAAIAGPDAIVSCGTVSPEQAFISFSSVCFSTFVKFFTDVMFHLQDCFTANVHRDDRLLRAYRELRSMFAAETAPAGILSALPPLTEDEVYGQIISTGKALVQNRLVDSYFGNISYIFGETVYISQTGSSMDELETCIDAVPLDGSSSSGITASSELSAHTGIFRKTGRRAIVHGHPKFTVIMSMSCRKDGCDLSTCYTSCREPRNVLGIPVVSGEIGRGPAGLVRTVPDAMAGNDAVIVYGHGIFSAGEDNFQKPFERVLDVEDRCREQYFRQLDELL
jgi:ribulose-5-phosphate 4-epimerase/fuculose-1-phosphate aldolase